MLAHNKMTRLWILPLLCVVCWFSISCDPLLDENAYSTIIRSMTPTTTPTFSPEAGEYAAAQSVTISTADSETAIRYTTDGITAPTETVGTLYSGPIAVTTSQKIKAIAFKSGWLNSAVATAEYVIGVATPTFSSGTGTYSNELSVIISTTTSGASIRYTTDGSTPTNEVGTLYSDAINVTMSQTIKAIAYKSGSLDSTVVTAIYVLQAASPTFNPEAGIYSNTQNITIASNTTGAFIRYTMDGSTPTETTGLLYSGPVSVTESSTLRAIAFKSGFSDSTTSIAAYSITNWITLGSTGSGTSQFQYPNGIALDATGHIYVADASNNRIVRIDGIDGSGWTTLTGNGSDQFYGPVGVAVDTSGRIYIADENNNRIVRVDDISGTGWTTFGALGTGTNQFAQPDGIAVDSSNHIYIADTRNNRIVRVDDMSGAGWTIFNVGENHLPWGIVVGDSGQIYIAEANSGRIARMENMSGTGWTTFGEIGGGINQLDRPHGIAMDASGHLFITDTGNNRIVRIDDMSGTGWTTLGMNSSTYKFSAPIGIVIDANGRCIVVDRGNNRIVRFIMP